MYEMMYFRNCNFINLISDAFFSFSNFTTYSSKSTFHSLCYTTSKNIQNIYKVMSFKFRIVLKFFSTIVLYSNSRFVLRKMLKNENIFYKNAKLFNLDAWDYIYTHTHKFCDKMNDKVEKIFDVMRFVLLWELHRTLSLIFLTLLK